MWFEAFWISTSILGAAFGTSLFLIYVLSSRIPTQEDLFGILATYGDAKLKEFGLTSSGAGGRPNEGFLDKILAIPGVQSYIGNMLKNMGSGTTGGFNIGP